MEFHQIFFMKFLLYFQKTVLYHAVEIENVEIVQLLLKHSKIDLNIKNISQKPFF